MGEDTEEMRRAVESTRADMSQTLDAIGDRVSPGRMVERSKNRFTSTVENARDRVMGSAHSARSQITDTTGDATDAVKHAPEAVAQRTAGAPMVAGAIAFGIGFLIAAAFPPSATEEAASGKVMDALQPIKDDIVESAQQVAQNVKEPAKESLDSLKSTATESARSVASSAKEATSDVKDQTTSSGQGVNAGTGSGDRL